jgi:translation elongation factor EF-1beta
MVTAIVFVKADVARIPEVAEELAALDGVSEVYSVTVADRLNKVAGVQSTETHIAFRSYSKHDLDSAFALGTD